MEEASQVASVSGCVWQGLIPGHENQGQDGSCVDETEDYMASRDLTCFTCTNCMSLISCMYIQLAEGNLDINIHCACHQLPPCPPLGVSHQRLPMEEQSSPTAPILLMSLSKSCLFHRVFTD
jgi:hypothetical protein